MSNLKLERSKLRDFDTQDLSEPARSRANCLLAMASGSSSPHGEHGRLRGSQEYDALRALANLDLSAEDNGPEDIAATAKGALGPLHSFEATKIP